MMKMSKHQTRDQKTIKQRFFRIRLAIYISVVILIFGLIGTIWYYNSAYKKIIQDLNIATQINFDFQTNIDSMMYQIVIGGSSFEEEDPYQEIGNTKLLIEDLRKHASTLKQQEYLEGITRLLNILEDRIEDIEGSYREINNYDINMQNLDENVYMLTELVQEKLSDFIHNEAQNLEEVRIQLERQLNGIVFAIISVEVLLMFILWRLLKKFSTDTQNSLEELCEMTNKVGEGAFEVENPHSPITEIWFLENKFLEMTNRIRILIKTIKKEQVHLRETELKLLQAQINPHFLYNTFDTIIWLVEAAKNEEAINMTTSLATFFKTTLSKGKDFITIAEEKTHIESYLEIQKARYRDILKYHIEIDEEIEHYYILKLTLQPLVENALYHGIKNKRGVGTIRIRGVQEGDSILISVEDDGIGIEEEMLNHLNHLIEKKELDPQDGGFGLINVNERIQLFYGEEYGLKLYSKSQGTIAKVHIPKKM